ncbi:MAG: histidine phosphatase family protein [Flavobacteriaceae bacterium]|nr:histidine phosphatase family protein [Flavobacteriaceae bacterium]
MKEIYLIRHAETEYNRINDKIGGRSSHLHITEKGQEQAQILRKWLNENDLIFDQMFCSTSVRAKETMSFLTDNISSVIYSIELEELSQGDWEGLPRKEIHTEERLAEINANNYKFKAPNGESQEEVELRMYNFITKNILSQNQAGKYAIVTHGMSIRCLLRKILNSNPAMTHKIGIDNTSVTKLKYTTEKGWELCYLNKTKDL